MPQCLNEGDVVLQNSHAYLPFMCFHSCVPPPRPPTVLPSLLRPKWMHSNRINNSKLFSSCNLGNNVNNNHVNSYLCHKTREVTISRNNARRYSQLSHNENLTQNIHIIDFIYIRAKATSLQMD